MSDLVAFLLLLALGRLFTWLLQVAGIVQPLWGLDPLLMELSECDLCLGFWVYLGLYAIGGFRFLGLDWPGLVEWVSLAAISSFASHLLRLGWHDRFGEITL